MCPDFVSPIEESRMKLYYAPGTCSLSPHIVLRELDLPFELTKVDLATRRTADGADFTAVNPKGYVPTLELDDGQILTEGAAIVQYLADLKPQAGLAPANGTFERTRLQEWLNFIASEIHKGFSPLFNADMPDAAKAIFTRKLRQRFAELDAVLSRQDHLMGGQFSVADAYLYAVLSWSRHFAIDLGDWPRLAAYHARVGARPSVKAAQETERAAKKAA